MAFSARVTDASTWKPSGAADAVNGATTVGDLYTGLSPENHATAHDMAKINYLFLKGGTWDGKLVVTPEWIKASVTPSVAVPGEDVRYGYKWWLYPYCRDRSRVAWAGSGFGDQLPIVIRMTSLAQPANHT